MTDRMDTPGRRPDIPQAAFWAAVVLGLGATGVALTAGREVGQVGALLLILLFAAGMVLFVFMSRGAGKVLGPFPERGAMETLALTNAKSDLILLDAMDEAALVTERNLSPVAANHAYLTLAEIAGALGESDRPPVMSRLFGADPMLSAPMFRLSKAAGMGLSRREELPPTAMTPGAEPVRFEASVGAMPGGRVLWRLREVGVGARADREDDRPLFVDDAPIGFFVAKPDGQIVYMNRALRAVLGIGDDPNKLRVRDFVKDDGARLLRREKRNFGAARAPILLRARDGVETPAHALSFAPLGADADAAVRVLVFFSDDEAPMAPAAAPSGAPRGAAGGDVVFQNAPFGAAVLDSADPATASILDANPALMEMTAGRAAPGAAFVELFDGSEGAHALTQRLRNAASDPIELQLAGASSSSVHVQFARGVDGGAIAYVVNVSDQRELEQRLAQSEKMREIGELAAGVAHDFNNLLTVVMQTCGSLLLRHPVGDADYPLLREIRDHATSAQELSEMLRAYARQQTFKREVVKVADFVGERQELIRRVVGAAINFDLKHGRDLPYVKVDKTQIERVLVNLATNARDAMTPKGGGGIPREGKLSIRTARTTAEEARALGHNPLEEGVYALIEVQDSGVGIKPEHQAKIFRPFHTTKEQGKGTGLGLASCYGIVKQSGGYIFFDSKIGQGTTFRIYLPEYEPTAEEIEQFAERERAALNRPARDVAGRGKILFVEDQEGVRRSIARNLVECGYEVVEAEHGEEALEILGKNPGAFDIIISDESMPVMSGSEMIEQAGADMIGGARVLFLSGYAPESFSKMLEQYRVSYMSKPVTMEQLVQRVKDLLAA